MKRHLIAALVLLGFVACGGYGGHVWKEQAATVISAAAINSTQYTGWIEVEDDRSIAFEIAYTYSAATAVTMSCETADDGTTTNGAGFDLHVLQDSATAGTSDSYPHVWSNAVSADEKWTWTVWGLPHQYINCWFDGTSADGSDVVTVKHRRISP